MKYDVPSFRHTKPTGTYCTIRARDDLDPSSDTVKVQHSGRSVTAIPENVGVCEIVDIGPDVTNVKPGDICFIDFFDVAQGYLVGGQELYVTQAMALRMTMQIETEPILMPEARNGKFTGRKIDTGKLNVTRCDITPLPGYALTKHAPDRMTVAVTGSDRVLLTPSMTTSGIVGGRDSDGQPATYVCYEEVVKVTPGAIQQERYAMNEWTGSVHDTYFEERRLKARIQRLEEQLREMNVPIRTAPDPDVRPGDLVVFCSDFSIRFRAMGEFYRCVPYKNILATIDDRAILEDFNRKNPPPPLVQIMGGGAGRLYGT